MHRLRTVSTPDIVVIKLNEMCPIGAFDGPQAADPGRGGAAEERAPPAVPRSRGRPAGAGVGQRRLPRQRGPPAAGAHALLVLQFNTLPVSHLSSFGL